MYRAGVLLMIYIGILGTASAEVVSSDKADSACEYLQTGFTGELLEDVQAYYLCNNLSKDLDAERLKELNLRYKFHAASEIHDAAIENEFSAKSLIGEPYGFLDVKIKRVRSTPDGSGAYLEIYNGGKNPYIYSTMTIPFIVDVPELPFWSKKSRESKAKLSKSKDGDIIQVVCKSENLRSVSRLSEDYGICFYFGGK